MFTVYHSNHLDVLKNLLLALIKQNPLPSPLQAEQILVQSPGMAQWLKIEIAKEQGIIANMEFPLPATFIWRMFTQVLNDVPKSSFFNKEAMTWKLMKLLPDFLEDSDFIELNRYLVEDVNGQKLFQLAGKIADIYDQYLVYRPEWIKAWEEQKIIPEIQGEMRWQEKLWQALYDHTLALDQSPYHRANLYENFIDTLTFHQSKPKGLEKIERVFIFGISALPPRYLDALKALGEHIDVHYMFTNPCRYYWGDIRDRRYLAKMAAANNAKILREADENEKLDTFDVQDQEAQVGNSLLASMGKLGRDNLLLLSELECREIDQGFADIERDSLLHHIQADILDLQEPGNPNSLDSDKKLEIALDDNSISIEICHSPMREVEVLHDRLLKMFEENPKLTPRDIIVMVANIDDYSPAIQAVFGSAPVNRYIPFSISDRSAEQESPVLNTFLHLLSLPNSRCSANALLEILQVPAVLRRFALNDDDFEKIKFWVEEAGVRWGLNETTANQFSLPEQMQNTWEFGLNRMLLGYAMPSEAGFYEGVKPYDEVEGLSADIAGKLAQFVHILFNAQKDLVQPKTGQHWLVVLNRLFDDIFLLDTEEELAGKMIRDKLSSWVLQLEEARFEQTISLVVVKEYLKDNLSTAGVSQRFLAGQVNFCTLMPMRSIPFQVVCLLGMNDGEYPRSVIPVGFDLMASRHRAGDRSRRDDDRYLFLEALQSAQKNLYISYVGRSIQDNSEKVPSVLISELLQYCAQGYCLQGDKALTDEDSAKRLKKHLAKENPLVPFSPSAFLHRPSYASEWLPIAKGESIDCPEFISEDGLPLLSDIALLDLSQLQQFYRLPVKHFLNHRLHVYFNRQDSSIQDTEPFSLDDLERYQLRGELLLHLLEHEANEASVSEFFLHQRAAGKLPLHFFGELTLENEQDAVIALAKDLALYLRNPLDTEEIDISISCSLGQVRLQGWLKNLYQVGMVQYRAGKMRPHEKLTAFIDHLCLCGMGKGKTTYLFAIDDAIVYQPIDKERAIEILTLYIEHYFKGMQNPLPYFPKTAEAALNALDKGQDPNAKIEEKFNGGYRSQGEKTNEYITRIWPELNDDLLKEIIHYAQLFLSPALEAIETNEADEEK